MANKVSSVAVAGQNPVTILWKGILMLPVVGIIDSKRSQDVMDVLLEKILDTSAKAAILDIMGVPIVDTAVANHLTKITNATKIMGCSCIITGVSPEIAKVMTELGIGLSEVITRASLKDGLEEAFVLLGLEVKEIKKAAEKK